MTALELVTLLVHAIYLAIFVLTVASAIRRPTRANIDIALFFGVTAAVILQTRVFDALGIPRPAQLVTVSVALLMTLPYLLLRLLDDITRASRTWMRAAQVALVASVAALIVSPTPQPPAILLVIVATFFILTTYAGSRFVKESRRAHGVTARRLQAIAVGAVLIGGTVLLAGLQAFVPAPQRGIATALQQLCSLGSALGFFLGFAPPRALWRAWQEPELRAFLARAASLPRLPDTGAIVRALEHGAAQSTGARASIGLAEGEGLRYLISGSDETSVIPADRFIGGQAYTTQRAIMSTDPARDDPANADTYRSVGAGAVIAAPITAGERRLGVLVVYADRPPVFAENDLDLVTLLADQAAVILESRALIDEAAQVRAHEEATRLKDDFLSAAAHDLKTPLTTLVAQAQFLERRAMRDPAAPADPAGLARIVREAKRLSALVMELLDVNRLEHGKLLGAREAVDLVAVARDAAQAAAPGRCTVEAAGPVVGRYDPQRIGQLFANLIENALKYSPADSAVRVRVWSEGSVARLAVSDHGIGVPPDDLPHVFERFRRGTNVDDRRFAGMGLGLYICQGIVEQHGGRIWIESVLDKGSTVQAELPIGDEGGRPE